MDVVFGVLIAVVTQTRSGAFDFYEKLYFFICSECRVVLVLVVVVVRCRCYCNAR